MKIVYIHLHEFDEIEFIEKLISENKDFKFSFEVPENSMNIRQCVLACAEKTGVDYIYYELQKYRKTKKDLEKIYGAS